MNETTEWWFELDSDTDYISQNIPIAEDSNDTLSKLAESVDVIID